MNKLLIGLMLVSFLISANVEEKEVGRYQLAVSIYENKKGTTYIVETVLDTKTGKVVVRRKKKASRYKLPYKDRYNKVITQE
tara:strand:+ start:328 stop:573 length:246 start_codon:yes stop_codon:yes gene_type:complete